MFLPEKFPSKTFTLADFIAQIRKVEELGTLREIMGMIPGMEESKTPFAGEDIKSLFSRMAAIYNSMTRFERIWPIKVDANRRRRIAAGAGMGINDVAQFLLEFEKTQKFMDRIVQWPKHGRP